MWVSLNPRDNYVSIVSFPRDLFVSIPWLGQQPHQHSLSNMVALNYSQIPLKPILASGQTIM